MSLATGGRSPEMGPGWCAGARMVVSSSIWDWDNLFYAVPVLGVLEFVDPKPLFHVVGAPQYAASRDFQFAVSPDGQRFIMPTRGSAPPPLFTVIENWQDKLNR